LWIHASRRAIPASAASAKASCSAFSRSKVRQARRLSLQDGGLGVLDIAGGGEYQPKSIGPRCPEPSHNADHSNILNRRGKWSFSRSTSIRANA